MDNYSIKFSKVMSDVKHKILFNLYLFSEDGSEEKKSKIDKVSRRFDYLEETTIRYILSNANACLCGSSDAASILRSYGIEPKRYDDFSDINVLGDYLRKVLSDFGCDFSLPSIDDINREVSIFGFNSKSDPKKFASLYGALRKCDTPLFYEMYEYASDKGLSKSEIFSTFCRIFKMLSYYNYDVCSSDILSYVPYLDCEIEKFFRNKEENFSLMRK